MKKYLYIALLMGLFASCAKSVDVNDESIGTTVLKVGIDNATNSRADVAVMRYLIEVYSDETYTTPANIFADGTSNKHTSDKGEFAMILDRSKEYFCLLWADKDGAAIYNAADLKSVKLNADKNAAEAWFGTTKIEKGPKPELSAILKRAVAKVTLLENGKLETGAKLVVNFKQNSAFNSADGTVATPVDRTETITIGSGVNGKLEPVRINSNDIFVLSPTLGEVIDIKFKYNDENERILPSVPMKSNFRTNITGHYTTKTVVAFSIANDEQWGDENISFPKITWAKGNLVANSDNTGCVISTDPMAVGLYFQFGSLVGWSTTGEPATVVVKPADYTIAAWETYWVGDPTKDNPTAGTGDPCRYYIKGGWRLPTIEEYQELFGDQGYQTGAWEAGGTFADGSTDSYAFHPYYDLKFHAAGNRFHENSSRYDAGRIGRYWSSTIGYNNQGMLLNFTATGINISAREYQGFGYPIRCVK